MFVGNDRVRFDRVQPVNVGRRILVPMRGVFEKMGATVTYDARRHRVLARRGKTRVVLPIGRRTAYVNGEPRRMDAYPQISKGHVVVPIRFVAETLNATVSYAGSAVHRAHHPQLNDDVFPFQSRARVVASSRWRPSLRRNAPRTLQVYVGTAPVEFGAAKPLYKGGRWLVPLREVAEKMGWTVTSGPIGRLVTVSHGFRRVHLSLTGGRADRNGIPIRTRFYPQISKGKVLVPITFFSNGLGALTSYNPRRGTLQVFPRNSRSTTKTTAPKGRW